MKEIDQDLMIKILKMSAELLEMHGAIAGDRICQDWSGKSEFTPSKFFTDCELDAISYNYELKNSNLEDYEEGFNHLDDEMVLSFAMSECIKKLTEQ